MRPKYSLEEITTKDGIVLQGIYHEPPVKKDLAILWIHGLTSTFYSDALIFELLINKLDKDGAGFASFNNRGHDMITGLRKVDKKSPTGFSHASGGAGYEKFEDCVYDIDAGITFLINQGYRRVILIGHSTGALKTGYYAAVKKDNRLFGIVAAGPISDRLFEEKTNKKLAVNLRRMKHMVDIGKGDYLANNLTFFPITARRYISLNHVNSIEQKIFDYGSNPPDPKYLQKIKIPLFLVLSENDEYADRPANKIKEFFDKNQKSTNYSCVILKNAFHGYEGQEEEFVDIIYEWIKSL